VAAASARELDWPELTTMDEIVKPSGILWRKTARKMSSPTPGEINETGSDGCTVENVWTSFQPVRDFEQPDSPVLS